MVVRVDLLRAEFTAEDFDRTIRDNLIGIHVRLGTRAGLPDDQREVIIELASNDFITGLDHGRSNLRLQTKVQVCLGRRFLEKTESLNHRQWHALLWPTNLEVLQRSLGLCTPVLVRRNLDWPESIRFLSELPSPTRQVSHWSCLNHIFS